MELGSLCLLPPAAAAPHTGDGFFPWAATQTASKALHYAETGTGKLPALNGVGLMRFFYDLCSKLPALGIVLE